MPFRSLPPACDQNRFKFQRLTGLESVLIEVQLIGNRGAAVLLDTGCQPFGAGNDAGVSHRHKHANRRCVEFGNVDEIDRTMQFDDVFIWHVMFLFQAR